MKSANVAHWDEVASRWRALGAQSEGPCRTLAAKLGRPPRSLILDAGCGPGLWSVVLAQQGYRVLGIDLSPRMIVEALDLARECQLSEDMVRFSVGDVERLDVPNATCDAIVCRNVLDFVPSPALALRELQRVLKPGGHLVLATLGAYSPVKRESWRRFLPGAVSTGITNHILPWEMEALLRELGWEVVAREACFGPSVSGQVNAYTTDSSCHLKDPVLLQSVATSWEVVTR